MAGTWAHVDESSRRRAEFYERKAPEARAKAYKVKDPDARATMMLAVSLWDAMARSAKGERMLIQSFVLDGASQGWQSGPTRERSIARAERR